jgi:hypothetical protein
VEVTLPEGYRLERDPDVLLLLAGDGRLVAAFSARGARQGVSSSKPPGKRTRRRGSAGERSPGYASCAHRG